MPESSQSVSAPALARAKGCLLGLAAGDALGLPAEFHRAVGNPWLRRTLWSASAGLDAQRVSRPLLPFSTTLDDLTERVGTDDTETAVVAALVLLATDDHDAASLFARWRPLVDDEAAWHGIAVRNALANAALGLEPPVTGRDSPVRTEDSVVAAAVTIGIAYHGAPDDAARVAEAYASMSHADDGVWAAQVMAAIVSRLVGGAELEQAIAASIVLAPDDSWLASNLSTAMAIADGEVGGFRALPELLAALSPRNYSHPGVAPETLPLALAIALLCGGRIETALPLSLSASRTSDSVPAMVGALCGAVEGGALDRDWMPSLDTVRGNLIPATAGFSLSELAERLVRRGAS